MLEKDYGVPADVFSVHELHRAAPRSARRRARNMLHPDQPPREPYVRQCLGDRTGPFIAATDYMRIVPDQIRQWVPGRYVVLGTDGYGRSDSRAAAAPALRSRPQLHRARLAARARRRRQARHGDGDEAP